ncbi:MULTISPECIES: SRPBCC family protein [Streptomycetaceae]|uniref:SRPBCC family protein n=1 Tax=Embleya scabrispora TaxID=159449 RepID=UPI000380503D|nr:SRPBCC family protein [Streptomyces sp. SID5474]
MTHIHEERIVEADADDVWAIVGEFETGPVRMAPGFVVDSRLAEPGIRLVTFANGMTARERLIEVDPDERSFTYAVVGGSATPTHDRATMRVRPTTAGRCTFVWTRDVLPDGLAEPMRQAMAYGADLVKSTMEEMSRPASPSARRLPRCRTGT